MKKLSILILIASLLFLYSCKPEPTNSKGYGKVSFNITHNISGTPLSLSNEPLIKNAAGNKYSFTNVKYYLSNFVLIRNDGSEFPLNNYQLIDLNDPQSLSFSFDKINNAEFKGIRMFLGVDSVANSTGDHTGALDPAHGMDWGWNFGYRFSVIEGVYKANDTASKTAFGYHIGRNICLVTINLNNGFSVNDDSREITINYDMGKMFNEPNVWDISKHDYNHSETTSDVMKISSLLANMKSAFSVTSIR